MAPARVILAWFMAKVVKIKVLSAEVSLDLFIVGYHRPNKLTN